MKRANTDIAGPRPDHLHRWHVRAEPALLPLRWRREPPLLAPLPLEASTAFLPLYLVPSMGPGWGSVRKLFLASCLLLLKSLGKLWPPGPCWAPQPRFLPLRQLHPLLLHMGVAAQSAVGVRGGNCQGEQAAHSGTQGSWPCDQRVLTLPGQLRWRF